jgi:hypothetical protein
MELFGRRHRKAFSPAWSYKTEGVIWQVMPDDGGRLVGEERDTGRKNLLFFCLETASGTVLWEQRSFGEPWWLGLEAATGGVLFLHGYARADMPQKKGIIAADLETGGVLWSSSDLTFLRVRKGVVSATKEDMESVALVRVDAVTGMPSKSPGDEGTNEREGGMVHVVAPEPLEESEDKHTRALLYRHSPPGAPVERIEFLRACDALVFSYWEKGGDPSLKVGSTVLNIVDVADEGLLYRDVLLQRAPLPVSPPFFMLENLVCYVRERRTLTAVRLTAP